MDSVSTSSTNTNCVRENDFAYTLDKLDADNDIIFDITDFSVVTTISIKTSQTVHNRLGTSPTIVGILSKPYKMILDHFWSASLHATQPEAQRITSTLGYLQEL